MTVEWVLFVEGESDKAFVEGLLEHLELAHVNVELIRGGFSNLRSRQRDIRRRKDEGRRIALALDADGEPARRRRELTGKLQELELDQIVERSFLIPDDRSPGDLETLLKQLAPDNHQAVHACFDAYINCLRERSNEYDLPDDKARIYAYSEAVGACTGPEKDYDRAEHWNLDSPVLDPLKRFLRSFEPPRNDSASA